MLLQAYMVSKNGMYGESMKCKTAFKDMEISLFGSRNDNLATPVGSLKF